MTDIHYQALPMKSLRKGEYFYIDSTPQIITQIAWRWGIKIRTEIVLVITDYKNDPKTKRITLVTIV